MATIPRIKSTRSGFLGVGITHVLILVLPFFARIVIGYPECYNNSGTAVNRRPKISFKAFKPYPFVLNLTNGTLWCEGRSITENVTEPYPVFVEMVFIRNGKSIKSIFKDQRLSITLYSDSINVTNIVPSDKFECNVLAVAAPCNVAYLQYKVLDARAPSFTHQYPQESYYSNWLQFSCDAIGFPEPEMHWILNNTVITNMNNSQITIYRPAFNVLNETFQVKSTIRIYNSTYPILVQCSARNSLNHTFSRIVYERYIQVKVTNITSSMVKVWWKIILYSNVSFDNVNGYKVSLTNQLNERYEINVGRNSKSVTISKNVSVNTSYTCKVIGLLDNGDRLVSGRFHFKTLAQIPKPLNVEVYNITSKTAMVQWNKIPPNKDLYGELIGYKIILKSQSQSLNLSKSIDNAQIELEDLFPETTYHITIFGYSQNEDGLKSDVKKFTTSALSLGNARKLSLSLVIGLTFGSFLFSW